MVNGSDIIEYLEENEQHLWESFVTQHLNGNNPIDKYGDLDTVFEKIGMLKKMFEEFCEKEYSERGI